MKRMGRQKEQGAVSLFVVIFAAMLMVVITISFVKLMIQDQTEASQTNLSQSAYDAAQAGVEDAKRLLLANQTNPDTYPISNTPSCDMVATGLGLTQTDGGVQVQTTTESTTGGNSYDESYTCDEITKNTPDFTATIGANQSVLVPITTTTPTASINLDWFTQADAGTAAPAYLTTGLGLMPDGQFPQTGWKTNQPPVLRVQMIHVDTGAGGFTLDDLDSNANATKTSTLFFVPNGSGTSTSVTTAYFSADYTNHTQPSASSPNAVACLSGIGTNTFATSNTGYACNLTLDWDTKNTQWQDGTYLRITPLYNNTSISLNFGGSGTLFNNIEPQIDSTGRASTLYRRVSTRVMYGNSNFPYPVAAVNTTGNFCKAYVMAPTYQNSTCTP